MTKLSKLPKCKLRFDLITSVVVLMYKQITVGYAFAQPSDSVYAPHVEERQTTFATTFAGGALCEA
jgi:hypothetical protein